MACVGDTKKVGRLTFEYRSNGRWGVVFNRSLKAALRKTYGKGMTIRETSHEIGIPHSVTQSALNHFELMRSKKARSASIERFLSENDSKIIWLYVSMGCSCKHIEEILSDSVSSLDIREAHITKYLKSRGIEIRDCSQRAINSYVRRRRTRGTKKDRWFKYLSMDVNSMSAEEYYSVVYKMTALVLKRYPQFVENNHLLSERGRDKNSYHVDHRYSVNSGYYRYCPNTHMMVPRKRKVSLDIICHPENLVVIRGVDNSRKGARNSISLKTLKSQIKEKDSIGLFERG